MNDVRTQLILEGDDLHVNRVQDIEPAREWAAERRKQPNSRGDFREKWTLTPVEVERIWNRYALGNPSARMDTEFWQWADKIVMSEDEFAPCRLNNKSNPYFIGYHK